MPSPTYVNRLIEEVQSRPALWDIKKGESNHAKSRSHLPILWKEVATAIGTDVETCKRKWKNLRDAFRAEVRRSERRMERDKLIGKFEASANYASKWIYFEALRFLNDTKRPSYNVADYDNNSTNSNDDSAIEYPIVKIEPEHIHHDDEHVPRSFSTDEDANDEAIDEAANDMLFEEFQNIATPQAGRRLSATLSMTNSHEHTLSNDASEKPASSNNCKCSKQTEDRVHFLEDLEKEEQKLMQSTNQDIKRALDHVGDSDYNFLVSFLPQMKKMNDLQNLQFRARICDLVLNILAPTISAHNSPIPPPPLTPAPSIMVQQLGGGEKAPAITLLQPMASSSGNQQNNGGSKACTKQELSMLHADCYNEY